MNETYKKAQDKETNFLIKWYKKIEDNNLSAKEIADAMQNFTPQLKDSALTLIYQLEKDNLLLLLMQANTILNNRIVNNFKNSVANNNYIEKILIMTLEEKLELKSLLIESFTSNDKLSTYENPSPLDKKCINILNHYIRKDQELYNKSQKKHRLK